MFYLLTVLVAFIAGSYLSPAIRQEGGKWYFYYSLGAGVRNKKKFM